MRNITRLSAVFRIGFDFLAKPVLLFWMLPWLMVIVVLGTISQKHQGLYEATHTYFLSPFFFIGFLPLPGGLLTIGLIFISLCVKFIGYSPWSLKRSGIILSHFGVLLLLLGGIVTALTSQEGNMVIAEQETSQSMADYFQRDIRIITSGHSPINIDFSSLKKNDVLPIKGLTITITEKCDNCGARAPSGLYDDLQGLAQNMELYPIPSNPQKEADFSGLILSVTNPEKPAENGTYMIMEDIAKYPEFTLNDKKIHIELGRRKTVLPFAIELVDFRKINYPSTNKAKEYESDLIIHDSNYSWPVTISMNKPLRYKGYSFYQSSFEQRPDIEITVLNVVKNSGRIFPYISSLIIFLGLLLHFTIRSISHQRREKEKALSHV